MFSNGLFARSQSLASLTVFNCLINHMRVLLSDAVSDGN